MKKYLLILAAALTIVGCTKKPAEQAAENQEPQQEQAEAPEQEGDDNSYIDITALTPEGKELICRSSVALWTRMRWLGA